MAEMDALPRSPSRYGSRLRLEGFPIADMFGQEAAAVVTNEASGLEGARKRRAAPSLLIGAMRGAMVRAEDFGHEARPGSFLASTHVAQELAWLQAEVSWSAPDSEPPLELDGATMSQASGWPVVEVESGEGSLVIQNGGPALRCHALLFTLRVDDGRDEAAGRGRSDAAVGQTAVPPGEAGAQVVRIVLSALEAGRWEALPAFRMPGPGTYLGLMSLDKRPRTIDAVRISFEGARTIGILDLALLTFG
jgi:hypothetical protein